MVVAMSAMRMVQMPVDQIVDMVAVRHGLVSAARTMPVVLRMAIAGMVRGAGGRIARVDVQDMLVDMIAVRMMKVTVVKIVYVVAVPYGDMAAAGAMLVWMIVVNLVLVVGHVASPVRVVQCLSSAWAMAFSTRVRTCSSAIR